jgi:DnaJ-class molecular chaperone
LAAVCSEGNVLPGKAPGPVIFVLETLPHARFARAGANLVHKPAVPLHRALAAAPITVALLDGTSITVPADDILTPGRKVTVPGKGLPDPARGPGARGDLVLEVRASAVHPLHGL